MTKDRDITKIAAKQRHLHLLGKVQGNQALSKSELDELQGYESQISETKKKIRQSKIVNRQSRRRRSLSVAAAKSLGYLSENISQADADSGLDVTLAGLFRYKKYAHLKAAFERGQFLRNLKAIAGVVDTVSEAAAALKLSSGMELRNILDTDIEVADIWYQTRLDTRIRVREAMLQAAKDGNQKAIAVVENYLKDQDAQRPAGSDLTRLLQKEIADLFDVNRVTVNDWCNKQKCPRNSDGTHNLYEVIRWYGDYERGKTTGKMPSADTLRDVNAEINRLKLAKMRDELVEIEPVVAGLVKRWQVMVAAFQYKRRELATMCHGQTVDSMIDIFSRHFDDLQRQMLDVSDVLELPAAAEEKLKELFEIIATKVTKGHEGI